MRWSFYPLENHVKWHGDVVTECQVVDDTDHEVEDHQGDVGSQGNAGSKFPEFCGHHEPLQRDEQEREKGQHVHAAWILTGKKIIKVLDFYETLRF